MIGFLHPWALAGLAAAAIPVLLHLLARREPPTVVFPAVRYLITTTREHQRRLKLQHLLLLLLLRTLLIVALVLAAAGPTVPLPRRGRARAERAGAGAWTTRRAAGRWWRAPPRLAQLQAAAREVLARATPDDALWLLTADGVPRRGDRQALLDQVAALAVSPRAARSRRRARRWPARCSAPEPRPGEIVLLTDLQASAALARPSLRVAAGGGPARRAAAAQRRASRGSTTGPQPWSQRRRAAHGESGRRLGGGRPGERAARHAAGAAGARRTSGGAAVLAMPGAPSGWWTLTRRARSRRAPARRPRIGVVRVAPVAG